MNDQAFNEDIVPEVSDDVVGRRLFLQSLGKWSGAAIAAAVAGGWLASAPKAEAAWVNRRGGSGGGWINGGGGGGGWINGGGSGGLINRR
jgi:hypothetical protein